MGTPEETTQDRDLTLQLLPAEDDPDWGSEVYQTAVQKVSDALICQKLGFSCEMLVMESADSIRLLYGVFHAALKEALPVIGTGLAGWFAGRNGRKVRLKVGDLEAEASSVAELERLLNRAQELQAADERRRLAR